MGDEVTVRVRRRASRVRCRLRHAGALDQDDHRDSRGAGDQIERREQREMWDVRRRETAGDLTRVLDPDQLAGAKGQQRGYRQCDQRGDRRDPGAAQHDHQHQCRDAYRRGGQRHVAWVGYHVPGFHQRRAALLGRAKEVSELTEDDVHGNPGQESGQHRDRDKPCEATPAQHARRDHHDARQHGEHEQRLGTVGARERTK
ncbi:MAG TPA: hypothetical protein VIX82_09000 [Solirubrobacteraceae bacterium]